MTDTDKLLDELRVLAQPVLSITEVDRLVRSGRTAPRFYPIAWLSRVWWRAGN